MLKSAALRMSPVVTPALETAVVAVPCTGCALKMVVSIPAFSNKPFSQRAIIELNAGLGGRIVVRNKGLGSSSRRKNCVLSSYTLSVATGHSSGVGAKAGKKNSAMSLDWRDCFANFVGRKLTP